MARLMYSLAVPTARARGIPRASAAVTAAEGVVLPQDWAADNFDWSVGSAASQCIGDDWLARGASLLLRVPSVLFAINKLDAVAEPTLAYQHIRGALEAFTHEAGITPTATIRPDSSCPRLSGPSTTKSPIRPCRK